MMRSQWELADVINRFREALEQKYPLSSQQKGVLTLLQQCHTSAMGGHLWHCPECGHEHISYNACRNRHCPKCNGLRRLQWVEARKAEAMPGGYAHIVFTLPHDLNDLCREYPRPDVQLAVPNRMADHGRLLPGIVNTWVLIPVWLLCCTPGDRT